MTKIVEALTAMVMLVLAVGFYRGWFVRSRPARRGEKQQGGSPTLNGPHGTAPQPPVEIDGASDFQSYGLLHSEAATREIPIERNKNMRHCLVSLLLLCMLGMVTIGCAEKTSTTKETKVSTPGGTTTVTTEKEVEKTGDNPPAEQP